MLQAMRDEVIVRPFYETKTKSGLIIPAKALEYKQYHGGVFGEVISIGPKFPKMFEDLKVGDKLLWRRHEGKKIMFEGEKFFAVRSRWVLGKVDE